MGSSRSCQVAVSAVSALVLAGCALPGGSPKQGESARLESAAEFSLGAYEPREPTWLTVRGRIEHETSDAIPTVRLVVTANSQRFVSGLLIDDVTSNERGEFHFRWPESIGVYSDFRKVTIRLHMLDSQIVRVARNLELWDSLRPIYSLMDPEEEIVISVYDDWEYSFLRCVDRGTGLALTDPFDLRVMDRRDDSSLRTWTVEPDAGGWWTVYRDHHRSEVVPGVTAADTYLRISVPGYEPLRLESANVKTRTTLALTRAK
jgi:hypothetical protein